MCASVKARPLCHRSNPPVYTGSRAQRCHFSPIRFKVLQRTTKQFRPFVNGQQRCKWETISHNSYTYRQSCPCTRHECISGEGANVYLHPFLTSELDGSERSAQRLGRFTIAEGASDTYLKWACVGAGRTFYRREKSLAPDGIRIRIVQPAPHLPHRLRYPGY